MQALLLVGGTDPSGGAGLTQDVLHAHDAGLWACPVVSSVTVQTPERFDESVSTAPRSFISALEAAARSVDIAGVKTGYLASPEQVEYLAAFLRSLRTERPALPIVIDPVGVPTAGQDAPDRRAVLHAIADKLLPLATVITPNLGELEMLADHPARDALELEVAAKRLNILGATGVLVKGAEVHEDHLIDRYITRYENRAIRIPRSPIEEVHGSGCALATRLAAHLVRGLSGPDAASTAAHEVAALRPTARFGRSDRQALLSPFPLMADPESPEVIRALERVIPMLLARLPSEWVAECGNNVAYVAAGGDEEGDAAVLRQRIRLRDGLPHAPAACWRPPTSHVARVALAAAHAWSTGAAALNLRHVPDLFSAAERADLTVGRFDRADEPAGSGSSVEWGTRTVLERGRVDLVADAGGDGKEPMVRLLARDPEELVEKLGRLVAGHATLTAAATR